MRRWLMLALVAVLLLAFPAVALAADTGPPEVTESFLWFAGVCYALSGAAVSLVGRASKALGTDGIWTWLLALIAGEILAFGVYRIFSAGGMPLGLPLDVVAIVGALIGLQASGLVDLSQYFGNTIPLRR